jgi:hypothetical protein
MLLVLGVFAWGPPASVGFGRNSFGRGGHLMLYEDLSQE